MVFKEEPMAGGSRAKRLANIPLLWLFYGRTGGEPAIWLGEASRRRICKAVFGWLTIRLIVSLRLSCEATELPLLFLLVLFLKLSSLCGFIFKSVYMFLSFFNGIDFKFGAALFSGFVLSAGLDLHRFWILQRAGPLIPLLAIWVLLLVIYGLPGFAL